MNILPSSHLSYSINNSKEVPDWTTGFAFALAEQCFLNEYIYEENFDTWINVWDPYNLTNFRFFYNINSTPMMYLLDENKKIIAKKISAETLRNILEIELGKTTVKDIIEKEQN